MTHEEAVAVINDPSWLEIHGCNAVDPLEFRAHIPAEKYLALLTVADRKSITPGDAIVCGIDHLLAYEDIGPKIPPQPLTWREKLALFILGKKLNKNGGRS